MSQSRRQYLIQQEAERLRDRMIQYAHQSEPTWTQTYKQAVDYLIVNATMSDGEPCIFANGQLRRIQYKKIGPSVYAVALK